MKYRLGFWFASVFIGCSSPSPSTSSSSNWIACTKVTDCSAVPGAVDCTGGYCVDSQGNRVSGNGASGSGGASSGGASSGGAVTGGAPNGGDGGATTGGTSSGGVGTGGFTTGGSHSGGAAGTGGGDSGVFTSCAACASGYFCFQWNNSSFVTCRPFTGSCDAGPTCECACPDIGAGDCGGGTTGCTCNVTNGKVEVHCSGA